MFKMQLRTVLLTVTFAAMCIAQTSSLEALKAGAESAGAEFHGNPDVIKLPPPDTTGGLPLMWALKLRMSSRNFSAKPLSLQIVSDLLWAAFGVNRADGRRTAPSAMNWQETDIYLVTADGLFEYVPPSHSLLRMSNKDLRVYTGTQDFVKDAPLSLVYVADISRAKGATEDDRMLWVGADCGFIAQNVYLYAASAGLACVVRGSIEKRRLANVMQLRPNQKIILAQTVGYHK